MGFRGKAWEPKKESPNKERRNIKMMYEPFNEREREFFAPVGYFVRVLKMVGLFALLSTPAWVESLVENTIFK